MVNGLRVFVVEKPQRMLGGIMPQRWTPPKTDVDATPPSTDPDVNSPAGSGA